MHNSRITNLYPVPVRPDQPGDPIDQSLTVSGSVVQFAPFPQGTDYVTFTVEGANVRVRYGPTDPTPTEGHLLLPGQVYTWSIQTARSARMIAPSADAEIFATGMTT